MKIVQETREVVATGIGRARSFSVEIGAHIMAVLSGLYKNPLDAIVREYLSNMVDAYLALGVYDTTKHPAPVLHLPTSMEPWLEFRDHGIGMSVDTVWNIYSTYGLSTKNADNLQVGGFGLGSKTAFCYQNGQAWTVESRYNGEKYSFMASLDEGNLPTLYHAATVKTNEPNGVTVRIPILRQDIADVVRAAEKYVPYFPMELTVTGAAEKFSKPASLFDGENWRIGHSAKYGYSAIVVMGNVPYSLDDDLMSIVYRHIPQIRNKYGKFVELTLPIGSVDLVPSRDSLKSTDRTKAELERAAKAASKEYADAVQKKLVSFATHWDRAIWLSEMSESGMIDKTAPHYEVSMPFAVSQHQSIGDRGDYSKVDTDSGMVVTVPIRHVWVLRNDGVKNIDSVARWVLSEKCYHKTRKGRKSKYGHKTGSVFVINTQLSDKKVSELFGGIPLDRFLGGASQFAAVAKKIGVKGKENIYRFDGGRMWGARVRIPDGDTVHYVILEQDEITKRWSYESLESLLHLRNLLKLDAVPLYGVRKGEESTFKNRKGWVNIEKLCLKKLEDNILDLMAKNPLCPAMMRSGEIPNGQLVKGIISNDVLTYVGKSVPFIADMQKMFAQVMGSWAANKIIPVDHYRLMDYIGKVPGLHSKMEAHDRNIKSEVTRVVKEFETRFPMLWAAVVIAYTHQTYGTEGYKKSEVKEVALDYAKNL